MVFVLGQSLVVKPPLASIRVGKDGVLDEALCCILRSGWRIGTGAQQLIEVAWREGVTRVSRFPGHRDSDAGRETAGVTARQPSHDSA